MDADWRTRDDEPGVMEVRGADDSSEDSEGMEPVGDDVMPTPLLLLRRSVTAGAATGVEMDVDRSGSSSPDAVRVAVRCGVGAALAAVALAALGVAGPPAAADDDDDDDVVVVVVVVVAVVDVAVVAAPADEDAAAERRAAAPVDAFSDDEGDGDGDGDKPALPLPVADAADRPPDGVFDLERTYWMLLDTAMANCSISSGVSNDR